MIPDLFKCPRRVGFLFPHACERLTPVDCPDCHNGTVQDPYRSKDRGEYGDVDSDSDWSDSMDFTEADGETLVKRKKFEEDPGES